MKNANPLKIRFFGILIDFMGLHELEMNLEKEITLQELVDQLGERSNGKFKKLAINPNSGGFSDQVLVFLNGKDITRIEGLGLQVRNGDKLLFYQTSAGG